MKFQFLIVSTFFVGFSVGAVAQCPPGASGERCLDTTSINFTAPKSADVNDSVFLSLPPIVNGSSAPPSLSPSNTNSLQSSTTIAPQPGSASSVGGGSATFSGGSAPAPSLPSANNAEALRAEVSSFLNEGTVISKAGANNQHFLFVRTSNPTQDHPMFIHDKDPNDGRFYVQEDETKTTVWAPPKIEAQARKIYQDWSTKNDPNDIFPDVAGKALAFKSRLAEGQQGQGTNQGENPGPQSAGNNPSASQTQEAKPQTESDHITNTQGHGLKPRPSAEGLEGNKTPYALSKLAFEDQKDEKTIWADVNAATKDQRVVAADKIYNYKTVHQQCYSKESGKEPIDVTMTILSDPNDPKRHHVIVEKGKLTGEQMETHLQTAGLTAEEVLEAANDETPALTYTEKNTEPGLKAAGFLHKQISLRSDGRGGFRMKYVQKTGPVEPAREKFQDDAAKDKIFYCSEPAVEKTDNKRGEVRGRSRRPASTFTAEDPRVEFVKMFSKWMTDNKNSGTGPQSLSEITPTILEEALGLTDKEATITKNGETLPREEALRLKDFILGRQEAFKSAPKSQFSPDQIKAANDLWNGVYNKWLKPQTSQPQPE